ncbi:MAG: nucleotidyltransferase family protein [Pseudomonadota bacterium]
MKPTSRLNVSARLAEPRLAVAVLAAGASRRFGAADKLAANFQGRALGEHVAAAIPAWRFAMRWVITSAPDHRCKAAWKAAGFEAVHNAGAAQGMGTSVALAGQMAREAECDGLLIALADMPLVPRAHFEALIAALEGQDDIVASRHAEATVPPAIFAKAHFERLAAARGDEGARRWLGAARALDCPPAWLDDIDTPEDLARLS